MALKSGLTFTPIKTDTWKESVEQVKSGKVDMFSAITQNKARQSYLNFTSKDIYTYPAVLITKFEDKTVYIDIEKDFKGKRVGIVKSSGLGRYIKESYPSIEYLELENTQAGFDSIRANQIDIFAINTVTAKYFIEKKGFDDLKIALKLDYIYHLKIAIRKDMPKEIISILNKSLSSISEQELHDIFVRWTQAPIEKETDWPLLVKIITVPIIIILILMGFNRRLNQTVLIRTKELTHKNIELKKVLNEVKERTAESIRAKDEAHKANQSLLIQQEKLASLGKVAGNVAHEINTPLGIANTGLSFHQDLVHRIKKGVSNKTITVTAMEDYIEQSEEVMSTINTNLQRAIELAKNFKHAAVDRTDDAQHKHNLYQLVSRITESMSSEFIRNNITCTLEIDPAIHITTHGSDLSQVVCNLVMNAAVHAFEGRDQRTIEISAKQRDTTIELWVSDNGLGVKEDIRSRIFEPFITTKRGQGGTGLGLNIVHNLVKDRLHGTIELVSPPQGGTQWRIMLPPTLPS
jgi:signal transduction histidine kinase